MHISGTLPLTKRQMDRDLQGKEGNVRTDVSVSDSFPLGTLPLTKRQMDRDLQGKEGNVRTDVSVSDSFPPSRRSSLESPFGVQLVGVVCKVNSV